jgi:uncharacterized membrane protein
MAGQARRTSASSTSASHPPAGGSSIVPGPEPEDGVIESQVALLLTVGTYASVALLVVGLVAMLAAGVSPLDRAPILDLARLPSDLAAGRPEAFLWLGLIAAIATPTARVLVALAGFVRAREGPMVVVAAGILGVIVLSVVVARLAEA